LPFRVAIWLLGALYDLLSEVWDHLPDGGRGMLARIGLVALLSLITVNGLVRRQGGDAFWLSPKRFPEKVEALARLGLHSLTCDCPTDAPLTVLTAAAVRNGVPPKLVIAVAKAESSFRHTVISNTGAMGLMQLMPRTASGLGLTDPFDMHQNVDGGARFLKNLLARYQGNVGKALAAYNAGAARVPVRGKGRIPTETQRYVKRVQALR